MLSNRFILFSMKNREIFCRIRLVKDKVTSFNKNKKIIFDPNSENFFR